MRAKILVTLVNKYDMVTEDGERINGLSVRYFHWGEEGEEMTSKPYKLGETGGRQLSKVSLPVELEGKIVLVPGLYDADFRMRTGSDGKDTLKVEDLTFLHPVRVFPLYDSGEPIIPAGAGEGEK